VLPAFRNELQPWGIFGAKVRSGSIAIETAARVMSALPSIATELRTSQVVRLVPEADLAGIGPKSNGSTGYRRVICLAMNPFSSIPLQKLH
jgi:hypothetical protein